MKYNYLLQLLILIIFVSFYSCSQNIKNQNCFLKNLRYLNGTKGTVSKNATNVGVRNVSIDTSQNKFTLTATIFCDTIGNNDAKNIEAIVHLPAEVFINVIEGPNHCLVSSNTGTYKDINVTAGYIKFKKSSMSKYESFRIKVVTSKPLKENASTPNFSIFVHNQSPEDRYLDNYWTWK